MVKETYTQSQVQSVKRQVYDWVRPEWLGGGTGGQWSNEVDWQYLEETVQKVRRSYG